MIGFIDVAMIVFCARVNTTGSRVRRSRNAILLSILPYNRVPHVALSAMYIICLIHRISYIPLTCGYFFWCRITQPACVFVVFLSRRLVSQPANTIKLLLYVVNAFAEYLSTEFLRSALSRQNGLVFFVAHFLVGIRVFSRVSGSRSFSRGYTSSVRCRLSVR